MKLSHSKLNTILKCPAFYKLSYIVGLSTIKEKTAFAIGSAVHWGLENNTTDLDEYYEENQNLKQEGYIKDKVLAESMVGAFLKIKDSILNTILGDEDSKLTILNNTNIYNVYGDKIFIENGELHELSIYAKLKSYKYKEFHDFMGIIDLLLLTNKGFIVIDYKTSSLIPDWDQYLDQLYRYRHILNYYFPDIPVYKVAIINLRKCNLRQGKKESENEFFNRIKLEYDEHGSEYIDLHVFDNDVLNDDRFNRYITNLSHMCDMAQTIIETDNYYINFEECENKYGRHDFYDIVYQTENCEEKYKIKDYVYNEEDDDFVEYRQCVDTDMLVLFNNNVIYNYKQFEKIYNDLLNKKLEDDIILDIITSKYIINLDLLDVYLTTYFKLKK